MWIDERGSEVVPLPECLRLVAVAAKEGRAGRLAVSQEGGPLVHPVNFAYDDRRVIVRLGDGVMAEAASGSLVAFEVDVVDLDEGCAWSVLVRGLALPIDEGHGTLPAHLPYVAVPSPGDVVLAIRTDVVTGRRFPLHDGGEAGDEPGRAHAPPR